MAQNRYMQIFNADKLDRRFQVFLIDRECDKYEFCNQKVYFLIGYLLEYKRLHLFNAARDFRFQVYDYLYDTIFFDSWAPASFRNVFWDVMLFPLDGNLWVLYDDMNRNLENVVE